MIPTSSAPSPREPRDPYDPREEPRSALLASLLARLRAPSGSPGPHDPREYWDELRDDHGAPRAAWRRFFARLSQTTGMAELDAARAVIARQVRENDIGYNVYADNGAARPWVLELLPFLIDAREWRALARGVAQRARLLNAIAADLYGPQTLLARGLVPPALVFGHPGYLRALHGYAPPGGRFLSIVACDLARTPDGQWTVLAHRVAEAAAGLGYALENRMIVSGIFPEPFRDLRTERIAPAYAQLAAMLAESARATLRAGESGMPHLALLTPGPRSETYFEHAFLARHLGLTLVEGKDLTVRQDRLYLKTLGGLERVHGVLRRIDDAACDPVELRADSVVGVPGLLQAMRAGHVVVTNAPGAGLVQSPALHGFLPTLSQTLLGEALALPTVPTWWCGEEAARREALDTLAHAFLLPTWHAAARGSRDDGPLGIAGSVAQDLSAWRERIEAAPDAFTLCQPLPCSCAPRYAHGALALRPALLRVYAFAGLDGAWHVVPGGFTRLAPGQQGAMSLQTGGSSADTWVLPDMALDADSSDERGGSSAVPLNLGDGGADADARGALDSDSDSDARGGNDAASLPPGGGTVDAWMSPDSAPDSDARGRNDAVLAPLSNSAPDAWASPDSGSNKRGENAAASLPPGSNAANTWVSPDEREEYGQREAHGAHDRHDALVERGMYDEQRDGWHNRHGQQDATSPPSGGSDSDVHSEHGQQDAISPPSGDIGAGEQTLPDTRDEYGQRGDHNEHGEQSGQSTMPPQPANDSADMRALPEDRAESDGRGEHDEPESHREHDALNARAETAGQPFTPASASASSSSAQSSSPLISTAVSALMISPPVSTSIPSPTPAPIPAPPTPSRATPSSTIHAAGPQQNEPRADQAYETAEAHKAPEIPASPQTSPAPPDASIVAPGRRTTSVAVSSRAAENLFWAGRYAERAENNVRLFRLILGSIEDDTGGLFDILLGLAAHNGLIADDDRFARGSWRAFEHALVAGLRAGSRAASIGQNLASQTAACGEIRGRLSSDHWRTVLAARNDFDDALARCVGATPGDGYERAALVGALERLAMQLGAISGAQGDRMMRDAAWRLLFVGRHIERVATMSMYLQTVAEQGQLAQPASFELLLQLFDSVLTYRSLYPGSYEARGLIGLLVVDPSNPRGLYGVYDRLRRKLDEIPQPADARRAPFAQLLPPVDALPALERLWPRAARMADAAQTGASQRDTYDTRDTCDAHAPYDALVQTCAALRAHAETSSSEVSARYFSHASLTVGS